MGISERRVLETLLDAGLALARPIDLERALHDAALQARRALHGDTVVIALARADPPPAFDLAVHLGGNGDGDATALAARFTPTWQGAMATGRPVVRHDAATGALELTAPVPGAAGALGAMTVVLDELDAPARGEDAERLLAGLAAQTGAAIERAALVRQMSHTRHREAVAAIAAGVAQALRNPLFGIASATQLLRFRAREDPVIERNVGRILREVEGLSHLSAALLEYAPAAPLALEPTDPERIWDEVLDGERGRLESRALALTRVRAHGARCLADREQLAQLFTHALDNALTAAPEASDLALTAALLPSGAWCCRLHNGGPPVPAELLPRVFELFVSTKPGASGIGLAICQRIVDDHHGTIALASTPEAGTTLTITLPGAPER